MKKILIAFLCSIAMLQGMAQDQFPIKGRIFSAEDQLPLPGASIRVSGTNKGAIANENGQFLLLLDQSDSLLTISYIGFETLEYRLPSQPIEGLLEISLTPAQTVLGAVEIVSTGYQEVPRERATGSFAFLNQELVDRRVSTNMLDRLQDITPGLVFNRASAANDPISIRGRGTIFANTMPLIIVDNFPYDGPIENINPNDVESVTVLKDAAAASIWGARAGNGVIVITTKKGKRNQPMRVSFNSNMIFTEAPDLFYEPRMTSAEMIEVERMLFSRGVFNSAERSINKTPLSPGVETLIALRDGLITNEEAERQLQAFSSQDSRSQLQQYFYRPARAQQYSLSLSGGGDRSAYSISTGYDQSQSSVIGNQNSRITLNAQNQWSLAKNRLEFNLGLYVAESQAKENTQVPDLYPYELLADEQGNPLPVIRSYSRRFIESEEVQNLLDWNYYPIQEVGELGGMNKRTDLRWTGGLAYQLIPGLKLSISHQYWLNLNRGKNLYDQDLFFVRDLINRYSEIGEEGEVIRNVPLGDILDTQQGESRSHNFRAQLNYSKIFNQGTELTVLGGFEVKDLESVNHASRFYGYKDDLGINALADTKNQYRLFYNNRLSTIPSGQSHSGIIDRFLSAYVNAAFTYRGKYTFSGSARRDASNLFGVNANQRAVPLWSLGASWVISEESFLSAANLPFVRLRTTYGYNGNIDRTVSAYTTGRFFTDPFGMIPGLPYADIVNPPNPDLRWERIGILNVGMDLETKDSRFRVALDFFRKNGKDIIGNSPVPRSVGVAFVRGNFASVQTSGLDMELNAKILQGPFRWDSRYLISLVREKVVSYETEVNPSDYLNGNVLTLPIPGKPLFSVFSLPFAGLDPVTGDPLGYLNGEPSSDYGAIFSQLTEEDVRYHGPSRPTVFGALTNNFGWKNFNLSVNISYRMGYYYRRQTVNYSDVLAGRISHSDFSRRWQNPGDELITDVASMPTSNNNNRNRMILSGSNLVEPGDHIRLQDIRFSYTLGNNSVSSLPFQRLEVYTFWDNVGMIWKASKDPMDPDFRTMKPLTSVAIGIKATF